MRVRYANHSDLPMVVALAREEFESSAWHGRARFSESCVAATAASFISEMGRTLLISDAGYLAGMVQPLGFGREMVAMEYAWFAKDGCGMELLDAFTKWADRMNVRAIMVHNYLCGGDDRLTSVLSRRRGFVVAGAALIKYLE